MLESTVVRIYATTQKPDYDSPWQARVPSNSTGSGVVVAPGRILTGAHVVANATFLQVQKVANPNKVTAEVVGICHDCDLALLEVKDIPHFMEGVGVVEIGDLPHLQERVSVMGFPVGGEEISITEGAISRIEVQRYSHSQRHLLAITVDAAINAGNSGGPVLQDGKIVGIAFQKHNDAEGTGEMVPAPLIRHFLANIEKNPILQIPSLGISAQSMENKALRQYVGLGDQGSGMRVASVQYGGSSWGVIEPGDTITEIDGYPTANNRTVRYVDRYRTGYGVMLGWKRVGDMLEVKLLRDQKPMAVQVELKPPAHLVPRRQYGIVPTYFIYGGLVFQTLTCDFLRTWNDWWDTAPKEFLHLYYSGTRTPEQQEVVVLAHILTDEINVGYGELCNESVVSVGGVLPRDMASFVAMLEYHDEPFEIKTSHGGLIVLDPKAVREANTRILSRYHVNQDRSLDLMKKE